MSKEVEEARDIHNAFLVWRSDYVGKVLQWFLDRMEDPEVMARLCVYLN